MRKCLKCGHVSTAAIDPEACPSCGAVYAKVEAARAGPSTRPLVHQAAATQQGPRPSARAYAVRMRSDTAYSTFRLVADLAFWFFVVVTVGGGAVTWWTKSGLEAAVGLVFSATALVGAVFFKESAAMLADLCDAALRIARAQDEPPANE